MVLSGLGYMQRLEMNGNACNHIHPSIRIPRHIIETQTNPYT